MVKVAVFLSGGGTTLRNLIRCRDAGTLEVDLRLVISSRASAGGLEIARQASLPTRTVVKSAFVATQGSAGEAQDSAPQIADQAYQEAMFGPCREVGAELVVMAGFLKHVLIPSDFLGRVINIHPSLIPAFCGAAMYGHHVHQAVLEYGAKVSGCTVHFVNNQYDNGPIILQRTCHVADDDTVETLADRVFAEECLAMPEAIRRFADGRLRIEGRRVFTESPAP